jgi:hypothetical protein
MKKIFEAFQTELNNESDKRKQSDYKDEKGIKDEYNGRQFLELLQNIDDAKSDKALIKLDTEKCIVYIANSGNPFNKGGLESLMMAHSSPKDKTFIGNKGLGFRSLLNWAGEVYVKSKNLSIEFSDENRKKQQINGLKRSICSTPEWIDENNSREWIKDILFIDNYITYICIHYRKEVEDKIIEQLNQISEELMFFINHLEEIRIIQDNQTKIFKKQNWKTLTKEDALPPEYQDEIDEEEFFQLKIIIPPKQHNINSYLFSYFPTNIKIDFPALVHATFELDSSRNTIVDDEKGKNRFIVHQLAKFIIEITEKLKEQNANWKAYEFVNIKHKNEILEKFDFYEIIEKWKESAKIYPCIDNVYRDKNSWAFYTNSFSDFMENYSEVLGNILKRNDFKKEYYRCHRNLTSSFNKISQKKLSIEKRAELLNHVLDIYKFNNDIIKTPEQLLLLINQDKKLKEKLFFYDDIFIDLEIPSFIEIDYIYPDLQKELDLDKDELHQIANVEEFDIQKNLIDKIIESDKTLQEKLQALYPLKNFDVSPSKSLKGITNKYIRDERILKIFDEKKIIEDYNTLGITHLEDLDSFLIWLGAKEFNALKILEKVISKNNEKKDIPSTLKSLFILKKEFSDKLNKLILKDIFVFNANENIVQVNTLFPYNKDCKKENIIANKEVLELNKYSENEIQEFFEWIGIKEFNPQNIAIEKIEQLRKKELGRDEVKEILQFLYNGKNKQQLSNISTNDDIYIFNNLAKKLFFRTPLTKKYFKENELLFPYSELGFENHIDTQEFFKWLGVKEADNNLIIKNIFKSEIEIKEKLKELFALFKEDNSIVRPNIKLELYSLTGQKKDVTELYINNDITRFCKKEKVVNIPLYEYTSEFFKWLGLQEPSKDELIQQWLNLLSDKNISIDMIKHILNLLSRHYQESDDKIDRNKPLYLFNNKKEKLKNNEVYQYNELVYKHIPDSIISIKLALDEKFLEWLGVKKAEPLMIIKTLLKTKGKNLRDIFELWKQDSEIKSLPKHISIKLLNRNNEKILSNKLFLEDRLTPFYKDNELVADYNKFDLENFNRQEVNNFLVWLGVNRYIKYIQKKDSKENVYKIEEIANLEFNQLFLLLEVENILEKEEALNYLRQAYPQYNYWILHNYGILLINPPIEYENNAERINLLKQFGVKEDFERQNTLILLKNLHKIDENGKSSPSIYQKILNKDFNFKNQEFKLFSKKGTFKKNIDLMYLNTSKHPKFILDKYNFIDLPINLDINQIYNTFDINPIPNIQYKVNNFQKLEDSSLFNEYFEKIKPYLLAFGSIGIDEPKQKEDLANKLKSLQVKFGNFTCFTDNTEIELEEFEMILTNQNFYIKCENSIEFDFSKNANLTDSIENILLTIDFNNHNKFRDIFRYGDFEELNKILSKEYGSTVLEDAKKLLEKEENHFNKTFTHIKFDLENHVEKYIQPENSKTNHPYIEKVQSTEDLISQIEANQTPQNTTPLKIKNLASIQGNKNQKTTFVNAKIETFHQKTQDKNFPTSYKYSSEHEKAKKNKGDEAETIVYHDLITKYGEENVIWESLTNDGAGYDISYNSGKIKKYVEVKVYSNNVFYITKNELDFAMNHKKSYEIYLVDVDTKKIHQLIPSEIDFEKIIPTQYKIIYSLKI